MEEQLGDARSQIERYADAHNDMENRQMELRKHALKCQAEADQLHIALEKVMCIFMVC